MKLCVVDIGNDHVLNTIDTDDQHQMDLLKARYNGVIVKNMDLLNMLETAVKQNKDFCIMVVKRSV